MFIVQSDVTLTKFLYLCRNQRVNAQHCISVKQECVVTDMIICLTLDILLLALL